MSKKRRPPLANRLDQSTVFSRIMAESDQTHDTRRALFEKLDRALKRTVVTYFTSFTHQVQVDDADADILEGVLRECDLSRGIALIISTPGGDGEAAERIVNLCRSLSGTGEYWAIVPGKAKSAGTMVCFGASRIMMGPSSELGPVDPQMVWYENGVPIVHSAHGLVSGYERLFNEAAATTGNLEPYLLQLKNYDIRDIEDFRQHMALSDSISIKTLKSGMFKRSSEDTIRKKISMFLSPEATKSHGRPIFREEAKACGLRVVDGDAQQATWSLIYELYVRSSQLVQSSCAKCIECTHDSFTAVPRRRS